MPTRRTKVVGRRCCGLLGTGTSRRQAAAQEGLRTRDTEQRWMDTITAQLAALDLATNFRCSRLVEILNTLLASYSQTDSIKGTGFPEDHHLLTKDRAIRGLLWAEKYDLPSWFTDEKIADEQKHPEDALLIHERKERILWLAFFVLLILGCGFIAMRRHVGFHSSRCLSWMQVLIFQPDLSLRNDSMEEGGFLKLGR
jgi:hypothetical protein